jgi:hypothetical protein
MLHLDYVSSLACYNSFVFPRSDNVQEALVCPFCSLFVWLVLICSERKALLAGGWADKPNE